MKPLAMPMRNKSSLSTEGEVSGKSGFAESEKRSESPCIRSCSACGAKDSFLRLLRGEPI